MTKKDRSEYFKKWRELNKERRKEYDKDYCNKNKEERKQKRRIYIEKNKDIIRQKQYAYELKRKATDSTFKLKCSLKSLISKAIRKKGYIKNDRVEAIVGCSYNDFKQHIESQWEDWMNWDNYGKYDGNYNTGWDIDHVIPLVEGKTEEDLIKLNHYTNLQPLCSKTNRDIKKDKYNADTKD